MSRLPARTFWYRLLRIAILLAGLAVCVRVLAAQGPGLPWNDVLFLSLAAAVIRLRVVVMRRDADGVPTLFHFPGTALVVIALLRDGPAAALAVNLLSALLSGPFTWRRHEFMRRQSIGDPFSFSALNYGLACVYYAIGGQALRTPEDCARFFHDPQALLLPLLAATILFAQILTRLLAALMLFLRDGLPVRRVLLDPLFGLFHHAEIFSGTLALVLWTAWGWGTLPYSVLLNEALLLAARNYFERLDALQEAECDSLTGLASWRGMDNVLRRRIAAGQRRSATFALLFLDVDGLKRVNDTYGHAMGDELLRLVGETCRLHARQRDFVARRSGDEFLVILDGLGRAPAERVMRRFQQAIEDACAVHPRFAGVAGVSAGLSVFPDDAHDAPTLIEMADRQMYHNKRARKAAGPEEAIPPVRLREPQEQAAA